MKNRKTNIWGLTGRSSQWLGACSIALCFLNAGHAMAQSTWTGAANSKWNEAGNWGVLPVASATLNFGGEPANMPTFNDFVGLTTGVINFTNNGLDIAVVGPPAGTGDVGFTLGTLGQSITLGGNINTTPIAAGGAAITDTINLNLILNDNRTIGTNGAGTGTGSHNVTINGIISETGSPRALTKGGNFPSGTLTLAGNNTYSGASSVTAGNLNIRHANALGSTVVGTTVSNGGAQLEIEGSGISFAAEALTLTSGNSGIAMLRNISGDNSWNGSITATTVAGTANLARIQSDAGTFTLAGPMSGAGADNSFVFQGAGNIDVTGSISGAIRVNSGVTGAGVRSLSNGNSYSGSTTVGGGVLRLNHVTAIPGGIGLIGGNSNINLSGGILGLGNGNLNRALGTGVDQIQLTAAGAGFAAYTADRTVNLSSGAALAWGGTAAVSTPGFFPGNTLVLGATSATHTVDFQNSIALAGSRFFRAENGTATVDGRLSGAITGSSTFSKAGAGTLELTNTGNAWTSTTFIDSGTLRLGAANVLPSTTLEIKRGASTDTNPILDLNGFSETVGGLTLSSPTTTTNPGQSVSIVNSAGGAAVLTITGTFVYNAGSVGFENGQATISANLNTGNPARNLTIGNGADAVDVLISGAISGTGNGFNKAGAGNLAISGANHYTGPTVVSTGTLTLGASNTLPNGTGMSIGAAKLDAGIFSNPTTVTTRTLDVTAAATINFGAAGTLEFSDSSGIDWTGGTLNLTGTFASGSSIRFGTTAGGLTGTQLGLISINGVPGPYTLSPTGYLLRGAVDPFDTWAGGAGFDVDSNNDGIKNGLAWLLGAADRNANASGLLPAVTQTAGSLKLTFDMLPAAARNGAQLLIEHSSNLGISDPWTGVLVPDATGGAAPVTFIISDSDLVDPLNPLDVEATISSTEAAAGKLFGRLKAVR